MKTCEDFWLRFKDEVKILIEKDDINDDYISKINNFIEKIKIRFNLKNIEVVKSMIHIDSWF